MRESFWGVMIVGLGITSMFLVYFFQSITNTSEHNYELLKETTEAAMYDSLDLAAYRYDGSIRIDRELFVESFIRRFADSVDTTRNYHLSFYDLNEVPPNVSVKVDSSTVLSFEGDNLEMSTQVDAILENTYDYDPLDDNTGTSYLILNNKKAEDFFENCKSFCLHRQTTHTEILGANPLSVKSLSLPSVNRKEFYDRIGKQDFKYVVDDYISQQNKRKKKSYKESIKLLLKILIFYRRNIKSFFYFLYYNFFSKRIKTNFWQGNILLPVNVKLKLKDKSCIYVKGLNIIDCRAEKGQIRLMEQSNLYLNSNILGDRVDISMRHGANLLIGNYSELKKNVRMKLTHNVTIGDFSLIADDVVIDDTNSGVVLFNEMTDPNPTIKIGTHVLLERGAVIKRGTELGDETIVQEFSVVAGKFQPRIVLGGCPAKGVNSNINWKYNFKQSWNYKM